MVRFILCAVWTVLFLILSLPLVLIALILQIFSPMARAKYSQVIISGAFKVVTFLAGTKIVVNGKENIPDGAVLYTPNHRSIFDIIITYPLCKGQTGYVAKKETKKFPIFSWWMSLMNCQFLDRKDLRSGLKMINKCIDLVKKGSSICIFPEGTRNKGTDPLLEFHSGSFKIAEKTGCPIVPVCIINSSKVFENQFPKIKKTTVYVNYLPAIETAGMSRDEIKGLTDRIHDELEKAYIEKTSEA
ncbi:1-acyl-sn-glycerol-3-phosphate acyltransferase [Lachnospiraceae bacterium YSD2013]|nr:1-acyl-sn-glycerol-3-phosphate acyltransferase [Lachnospiraceae bacterium YSD2013]